jgi:ATP-dependent helicase/nuclease subunit B
MPEESVASYRESFDRAVQAAVSGALVLTPNTRSAAAVRSAADRQLGAGGEPAWRSPEALPFGAFLQRLLDDAVLAGALRLRALGREQELELWRQGIEQSPAGRQMLLPGSAAALASESFRTALEWGLDLASPAMRASSETRAFAGWAAGFQHRLA